MDLITVKYRSADADIYVGDEIYFRAPSSYHLTIGDKVVVTMDDGKLTYAQVIRTGLPEQEVPQTARWIIDRA